MEEAIQAAIQEILDRIEQPAISEYSVSAKKFRAKGDSVSNNRRVDRAMKDL